MVQTVVVGGIKLHLQACYCIINYSLELEAELAYFIGMVVASSKAMPLVRPPE